MTPVLVILLTGPALNGAGSQSQHLGGRFQPGSLAHGLIDQFQGLLPL
jgi:hypothetical protein